MDELAIREGEVPAEPQQLPRDAPEVSGSITIAWERPGGGPWQNLFRNLRRMRRARTPWPPRARARPAPTAPTGKRGFLLLAYHAPWGARRDEVALSSCSAADQPKKKKYTSRVEQRANRRFYAALRREQARAIQIEQQRMALEYEARVRELKAAGMLPGNPLVPGLANPMQLAGPSAAASLAAPQLVMLPNGQVTSALPLGMAGGLGSIYGPAAAAPAPLAPVMGPGALAGLAGLGLPPAAASLPGMYGPAAGFLPGQLGLPGLPGQRFF